MLEKAKILAKRVGLGLLGIVVVVAGFRVFDLINSTISLVCGLPFMLLRWGTSLAIFAGLIYFGKGYVKGWLSKNTATKT